MTNDPGLFHTMYTARALRRFKPDPIPEHVLFQIFDAGIRAPSGQNAQDWRFVVITGPAIKQQMQEWATQSFAGYSRRYPDIDSLPKTQRLSLLQVEHLAHNIGSAPVVVAVCGLHGRHSTPGGSTFPAVQNMLLAARAFGLSGSVFNLPLRPQLKEMLGVPENNDILCLLPLGYPIDKHGRLSRKPVKKVVFWEKFGQPWAYAEQQPDEGWTAIWE